MEHFLTTEIHNIPFCALDFETTQINGRPGELAIIEIGAQNFTMNGIVGAPYVTLINPGCNIRPFDTGVSGINDRMVSSQPKFIDIFSDFFSYIHGRILVAHNAPFDKRALTSQCQRDRIDEPDNVYIDSVSLLKKTVTLKKYSLQEAVMYFKLNKKPFHRALGDCYVVSELFCETLKILRTDHSIRTFGQLTEFLGIKIIPKSEQLSLF